MARLLRPSATIAKHLLLAWREGGERALAVPAADEAGHDRGVDDGVAVVDAAQHVDEDGDVEDALLEQVAAALRVVLDQPHGEDRLDVLRKDEYPDVRMLGADLFGGDETFVGVGRRHADVDDGDVRVLRRDFAEQHVGIGGLADDLHTGVAEQAGDSRAGDHHVVGDHYAHGNSAVIWLAAMVSRPSIAPTRSVTCMRSAARSVVSWAISMCRLSAVRVMVTVTLRGRPSGGRFDGVGDEEVAGNLDARCESFAERCTATSTVTSLVSASDATAGHNPAAVSTDG